MKEQLLAFIWKLQLFANNELTCTKGDALNIAHPGYENYNAGPDFLEAQLSIGKAKWFGNVEIHIKGSDWYRHKHDVDPAYDNVILHVVFEDDKQVYRNNGIAIKTLELQTYIPEKTLNVYRLLMQNEDWIPCVSLISSVEPSSWTMLLEEKGVERIVEKAKRVLTRIEDLKGDWEQLAYEMTLRTFGFGVNAEGFGILGKKLPINILRRESGDELNQEALLFGMGASIDRHPEESKILDLEKRFQFLRYKHSLVPLKKGVLRYLRTRPSNFPSSRLLQIHKILLRHKHLFESLLELRSSKMLKTWLPSDVVLSNSIRDLVMINMIIPLRMAWHLRHGESTISQNLIDDISDIKAEDNKLIRQWKSLGVYPDNAIQTQGMKHLYENYCRKKNCLECKVGVTLLSSKSMIRAD